MSIGSILSWIVCGLAVGICARFLVPGRQYMSLTMTALLGIGGGFARAGFATRSSEEPRCNRSHCASHNWYGWIVAILGATLLVWIYPYARPRRWWQLRR